MWKSEWTHSLNSFAFLPSVGEEATKPFQACLQTCEFLFMFLAWIHFLNSNIQMHLANPWGIQLRCLLNITPWSFPKQIDLCSSISNCPFTDSTQIIYTTTFSPVSFKQKSWLFPYLVMFFHSTFDFFFANSLIMPSEYSLSILHSYQLAILLRNLLQRLQQIPNISSCFFSHSPFLIDFFQPRR